MGYSMTTGKDVAEHVTEFMSDTDYYLVNRFRQSEPEDARELPEELHQAYKQIKSLLAKVEFRNLSPEVLATFIVLQTQINQQSEAIRELIEAFNDIGK